MKHTITLRLFSVITAASAALFFTTSCGEKKDAEAGTSEKESEVDTPDSLADELITQFQALTEAIGSAEDKASAEKAVKKINSISDEVDAIAARLDKLETPSEEDKKLLDEKMEKAMEASEEKMQGVMMKIQKNEEVAQTIMPALMEFGKRMDKNEAIFKRFGKGSN